MFKQFTLNIKGRLVVIDRPQVMGIINVTTDSFHPASRVNTSDAIRRRTEAMVKEGVDIIDIGAYSTRPRAVEVSPDEEMERLALGMTSLREVAPGIPVSVDTFRASVAREAISLGADIINDISGGNLDSEMFRTAAALKTPYILTHSKGSPADMQTLAQYGDVTSEVVLNLSEKLRALRLAGVSDVILDPGFGFAKTLEQNYRLMRDLEVITRLIDAPLLAGVSRKSMLTRLLGIDTADALNATTALNTIALMRGASILRVHDVAEAVQAVKIFLNCI